MKVIVSGGEGKREIKLPVEDVELNWQMARIGVGDVVPRCMLKSVEEEGNPLKKFVGQIVNMDELNYLAKRLESLTDYEKEVIQIYANEKGAESVKDLINLTFSTNGLSMLNDFSDMRSVGRRLYLDEFSGISQTEEKEIDFIEFAEKTLKQGQVSFLSGGVFVEHGFRMQEPYQGKTFPEYNYEGRAVTIEFKNCSGEHDYLYLPTNICEFDKLKARLGIQSFTESRVKIIDANLPDNILALSKEIQNMDDLNYLNELCMTVRKFDEDKMKRLEMAAEFVGAGTIMDATYIATHLSEFEIVPDVHNDEEYGRFLVEKSGMFNVDDVLLPHIRYADFAADKRQGALEESGYVSGGFVGTNTALETFLNYRGEYADLLERNEENYKLLRFYNPLSAFMYEDGVGEEEPVWEDTLVEYEPEILKAIKESFCTGEESRGLMHYFGRDKEVAAKVLSAFPTVKVVQGELYGVLECRIREPLTEREMKVLKDYWTGQMSDGWGEGFEQHPIVVDDGELYVSFWSSRKSWELMTEEEFMGEELQEQAQGSGMNLSG